MLVHGHELREPRHTSYVSKGLSSINNYYSWLLSNGMERLRQRWDKNWQIRDMHLWKLPNMKANFWFIITFALSVLLTVIAVFFRDRGLFLLHGYELGLINTIKPEAFEAYKDIYQSKGILLFLGLIFSTIALFLQSRINLRIPNSLSLALRIVNWLVCIVFLVNCIFYVILPKRLFWIPGQRWIELRKNNQLL